MRRPSLQEHMLVDIDTRRTDLYRKGADAMRALHPLEGGQAMHLASVG